MFAFNATAVLIVASAAWYAASKALIACVFACSFALAVTAYWVIGYSLMYGGSVIDGWLYFQGLFVDPDPSGALECAAAGDTGCLVPAVDFLFQSAFAGTAATIVSGLVAERVKFGEFVVFSVVKRLMLYPPI